MLFGFYVLDIVALVGLWLVAALVVVAFNHGAGER